MIDYDRYKTLLREAQTPRYVWKAVKTCTFLQGSDIKNHIKDCDEIILFAATLGFEVDALIRQTEAFDMAGAVVLDALASEEIERVCNTVHTEIGAGYARITKRFSPGYGDFPLDVQGELLAALDAQKKIGLYANDSNLLIPRKSVTAIVGATLRGRPLTLRGRP